MLLTGSVGQIAHEEVHVGLAHHVLGVVDVVVAVVVAELEDHLGDVGMHDVDVAGLEGAGTRVGIGDRPVGDLVQVGQPGRQ